MAALPLVALVLASVSLFLALVALALQVRLARRVDRSLAAVDTDRIDARVSAIIADYQGALAESERSMTETLGKLRTYYARLRKLEKAATGGDEQVEREGADENGTPAPPRGGQLELDPKSQAIADARRMGIW